MTNVYPFVVNNDFKMLAVFAAAFLVPIELRGDNDQWRHAVCKFQRGPNRNIAGIFALQDHACVRFRCTRADQRGRVGVFWRTGFHMGVPLNPFVHRLPTWAFDKRPVLGIPLSAFKTTAKRRFRCTAR